MKYKSKFNMVKNVILSLIAIACIVFDCWCFYISKYGVEKIASHTFKIGQQVARAIDPVTNEIKEEYRYFCEVNMYDNCYEIAFNYFTDEGKTSFYSQGLQFFLPDTSVNTTLSEALNNNYQVKENLVFNYKTKTEKSPINIDRKQKVVKETLSERGVWPLKVKITKTDTYYYSILKNKEYKGLQVSNFASENDYEDTIFSSNPLNENSYFAIDIGGESYYMKMRGSDFDFLSSHKDNFYILSTNDFKGNTGFVNQDFKYDITEYYRNCDIYYLAEVIFNSCQALNYTSEGVVINFEFDNLFNYYYDFSEVITEQNICDKVRNFVKTYCQIKVNKHQGKMTSASQSIFNNLNGSSNYDEKLAGSAEDVEIFTDYHHGKTILEATEGCFDIVLIGSDVSFSGEPETDKLYLVLKDEYRKYYPASNKYRLKIKINLDKLFFRNAEFAGIKKDTISGYNILEILTESSEDGIKDITSEVINNV